MPINHTPWFAGSSRSIKNFHLSEGIFPISWIFSNFCIEVEEKIQDLKAIEDRFEQDDAEKCKMQDRIKSILGECENLEGTITEKTDELTKLEEDISIREKEKFEDKI